MTDAESRIEEKRRRAAQLLAQRRAQPDQNVAATHGGSWPAVPARVERGAHALSPSQRRLWFLQQLQPQDTAYHISFVLHLDGHLDAARLAVAWTRLCERHPVLTTRFFGNADEPTQRFGAPSVHVRRYDHDGNAQSLQALLREWSAQPFDLMADAPVRIALCTTRDGCQSLWFCCHHILLDGRSVQRLIDDLDALYLHDGDIPAPAPPAFAQVLAWQAQVDAAVPARLVSQQYWETQHRDPAPALSLPSPEQPPLEAARTVYFEWEGEPAQALRALARECEATPAATLLALYGLLLTRCANATDCVIGMPMDGRPLPALAEVCGFLANTVAIRSGWRSGQTFREHVRASAAALLEAQKHQFHSFDGLVKSMGLTGSGDAPPLFQAMLAYQRRERRVDAFAGLSCRMEALPAGHAKFDLTLLIDDDGDRIQGRIEHDSRRVDGTFAAALPTRLESLLRQVLASPDRALQSLDLLVADEASRLMRNIRAEQAPAPDVAARIWRVVRDRPEAIALRDAQGDLGYAELWAAAERIAQRLPVSTPAGRQRVLAVVAEDAREQLTGLLSALLAGCAYLPLSAKLPPQRQQEILRDAAPLALLANEAVNSIADGTEQGLQRIGFDAASRPSQQSCVATATHERSPVADEAPAYVIYTSGSTGRPKGVALPRRTLNRLIDWQLDALASHRPKQVAQYSNFSFDVSLQEMLVALCAGATYVALPDPQRYDFDWLGERLQTERIDTLYMPTAVAMLFLEHLSQTSLRLESLRHVLVAGEELRLGPAHRAGWSRLPNARLSNQYGPSETHVVSADWIESITPERVPSITIGTAIAGSELWILDQHLQPLPPGCIGELYLGGDGLAHGYIGQPAQTASRFLPHPGGQLGARLYRTGDLARLRADGRIDFLGRTDHQIKIRGHRVELGEIEQTLLAQPGVRHARVTVHGTGSQANLIGYVAAPPAAAAELKSALAARLPHYMVPAAILCVDPWPITANGKVDTRALPDPALALAAHNAYEPPRDAREQALAHLWSTLLGVECVGRNDDFFERGGHSLLATRMLNRLRAEYRWRVSLTDVFAAPRLADLAERLHVDEDEATPLPAQSGDTGPLSFSQRRLWFLHALGEAAGAYNEQRTYRLRGEVDVAALRAALTALIARHDALRTGFEDSQGEPLQRVAAVCFDPLQVEDLRDLDHPASVAQALLDGARAQPFELSQPPLLRAQLLGLGDGEWWLGLTVHHIVTDGWSMDLIARDISAFYAQWRQRGEIACERPALQFLDVARWERARADEGAFDAGARACAVRLAGAPLLLDMPTDRPRSGTRNGAAGVVPLHIPASLDAELRAFCREQRTTPYMVLMAAYCATLHRYSGQDDLCVGTVAANRDSADTEDVVGFFVNTVPVRSLMVAGERVDACLDRIRDAALEAFSTREIPFEAVVEQLQPERNLGYAPVVQVVFNLQNTGGSALNLDTLAVDELPYRSDATKFDLSLSLRDGGDVFMGGFEFARDLFDEATINRFAAHFLGMLRGLLGRPEREVLRIDWAGADEHAQLRALSGRDAEYPRDDSVVAVFRRQAARTPHAVALCCADAAWTYAELDAFATRVACALIDKGVRPGASVAICLPRSMPLIGLLLGTLMTGAAYVPIDPSYPQSRIDAMLADAAPHCLIAETALTCDCLWIPPAELWHYVPTPAEAAALPSVLPMASAYLMYTSGSTGRPKGISVPHRAILRLVLGTDYVRLDSTRCLLQLATVAFDAATFEIWGALLNGGRLAIPSDAHVDFAELRRLVRRHGVNTLWLTAGLFHALIDDEPQAIAGVEQLLVGGDVVSPAHVNRVLALHPGLCVINGYGPTENTTFSACDPVRSPLDERLPFPIGRPIANTRAYVLDAFLASVPIGVPGELYVGGDGLAHGYHARPGLTAAAFVPNPFAPIPGARMYRTGDIVRWRADGRLEFIGRRDGQVKLRGFRIELGEIEQVLTAHPAVRTAVIKVQDTGVDKRLVAYVASDDAQIGAALEAYAREHLPGFMVPWRIVAVSALPLTRNGKVDRAALPDIAVDAPEPRRSAPEGPTEHAVATAFAQLLGVATVHREDDFFALGGHSLLATRLLSLIRRELGRELTLVTLFQYPTVSGLASQLEQAALSSMRQIGRAERSGPLPLSFAQQRLWFLERLGVGEGTYNVPVTLALEGEMDPAALHWSVSRLVERHESLRTRFLERDGEPWQQVDAPGELDYASVDARSWAGSARDAWLHEAAMAQFDLATGPLLRVRLLRDTERSWRLLLVFHHIVADGWSLGVVARELNALYASRLAGGTDVLAALPLQYADYAVWQRAQLEGAAHTQSLTYWREALSELPPLLRLPTDRPRPSVQGFRGRSVRFTLPSALTHQLRAVSRAEGVTLFMTLLGGFQALLSRYAGTDDVAVGTPVANRTQQELEELIGFFVNTLVMRCRIDWSADGRTLLQEVKRRTLAAFEHQNAPFEQLVDLLQPQRSLSYGPLIQVMFALQNAPSEGWQLPGLQTTWVGSETTTAKFDLTLTLAERGDTLEGTLEYAEDLFDASTVRRMLSHYEGLLAALSGSLQTPLNALSWQSTEEAALCARVAVNRSPYPSQESLTQRFLQQARRYADAPAIVDDGQVWSYARLSERSLRIAHGLRAQGVGLGARVGVCLPRGAELVATLLGIVGAGGVYVPLDPDYPAARIAQVLTDAQVCGVVGDAAADWGVELPCWSVPELANAGAGATWSDLPDLPAQALCYVIYTSGSTGRPKGVAVSHRGVMRLACDTDYARLAPGVRIAHVSNPAFDAATFEIWGALLNGGCVVVVEKSTAIDPPRLRDALRAGGVDTLFLTTSLFNHVARTTPEAFDGLETVLFGGEQGDPEVVSLVRAQGGPARLVNVYGPTEMTTFSTSQLLAAHMHGELPIGFAIANTEAWVLDASLRPVPLGVMGELYLGGPGLAAGYWANARQTAERFVPHPFGSAPGERLYATGDLVRQQADGALLFVGRVDHQVKVRGFRIELGEVEARLLRCPGVDAGVVQVHTPGGRRDDAYLVAYASGTDVDEAQLRAWLSAQLPEFMVPSVIVVLERMPLTATGKIDRRSLPEPLMVARTGEPPRTQTEHAVATAFAQLLGVATVHREDDFFALGGHSLLAVKLCARLRHDHGTDLPLVELMRSCTPAALASLLTSGDARTEEPVLSTVREGDCARTLILLHPAGGNTLCYRELVRELSSDARVLAIDMPRRLDGTECNAWFEAYADAVAAAAIERPVLLGWSFAGVLAYGLAQKLRQRGRETAGVILLDSDPRWVRTADATLDAATLEALTAKAFGMAAAAANASRGTDPGTRAQWTRHLHALRALRDHTFGSDDPGPCHLLTTPQTRGWLDDAWRPLLIAAPSSHTVDADHDALLEWPAVAEVAVWVDRILGTAPENRSQPADADSDSHTAQSGRAAPITV